MRKHEDIFSELAAAYSHSSRVVRNILRGWRTKISNASFKQIKKIHFTGICGIAMGSLAGMFRDRGYEVSGSDENMYPPMSSILEDSGIELFYSFKEENLKDTDLVIIGNSISRGNSEAEYVLNNNIPYMSMAQALYRFFLAGKEVISVSGTHGKSTTTALLAHIFETAGMNPSFFVGAFAKNFSSNYKLGRGDIFIIEGDEYDSAFFEKIPKFIFYRPKHLVLTSLEFDHADIFSDLNEISLWFKRLVNLIPSGGNIIYSSDYRSLQNVIADAFCKTCSFGRSGSDFTYSFSAYREELAAMRVDSSYYGSVEIKSPLMGDYNYSNITAAVAAASLLGIEMEEIKNGVESFLGLSRRQEIIYRRENITIYEDFAHHPTSIDSILRSIRERYGSVKIWALYEPGSATGRRNTFQDRLPRSFNNADYVIIKDPVKLEKIPESERIDMVKLTDDIKKIVPFVKNFVHTGEITGYILENINLYENNIIIIMSNSSFGGIYDKIKDAFDSKLDNR